MAIQLYNTMTRRKDELRQLRAAGDRIGMYVCGPTVYDLAHIGNARPVVVFDVLSRLLRHDYGKDRVAYVRNITDVDDKIIAASAANGETIDALTARTERAFHADMAALGALPPDVEPRATRHIAEMVAMIERLIVAGHAYAAEGHVLFSVTSMPEYGRLSRRTREEMIDGARVEVAPYKRDPGDFVLWKPSTPEIPGWESPWGRGRPGWHIECSAMSETHLGEHFDIHGGGLDLIFPHHENELAQSTCAHGGRPFVDIWMHNGFLTVNGEKMSKSLGNFFTVRELLAEFPGEAIRLLLLRTHYRQPIDFTRDGAREAKASLDRWYRFRAEAARLPGGNASPDGDTVGGEILEKLRDDLNTPAAIALVDGAVNAGFHGLRSGDATAVRDAERALALAAPVLGLLEGDPEAWLRGGADDAADIEAAIAARQAAKQAKNYAEADRIRADLLGKGIVLEDRPGGRTEWRRA